jgi:hypothetical protein
VERTCQPRNTSIAWKPSAPAPPETIQQPHQTQPATLESNPTPQNAQEARMIRKLKSGEYRLYSRKKDSKTGKRKNLGTFSTMEKAKQHEKDVQYFKRAG